MKLSTYKQTQLVIWINQFLFFYFLIFNFQYWMIFVAFSSLYIFGFMSETSLHRFYTHKSFETTPFKEKILRFFSFIVGQGPTLSWVTVHRTHHAFEETEKDPHSPKHLTWWKIYLSLLPNKYSSSLVVDMLRKPGFKYFVFENNYYFYLWTLIWILTYYLNFNLFFFIVSGSAMWYIGTCMVNIISHSQGEKKFVDAVAYNNKFVNFFTGVGNHNNHHKFPKNFSYSLNKEIDIYALGIKYIFKK